MGSFWCLFLGVWVCVHSRTLWVSPADSPVRLGLSPAAGTPTDFYSQRFEALFPCAGTLGWAVCLAPQLFLLVYSHASVGPPATSLPAPILQQPTWRLSSPPQLPISTPPTSLDECFFFNSLVVRLPYSTIFWQFWLVFVFKFVVVLFRLWEEAQCIYLCLHLGQKSLS